MDEANLKSAWDSFLVALPFVGVLLVTHFRLDELIAAPKINRVPRRPPAGVDENGRVLLSDPDGRPWVDEREP